MASEIEMMKEAINQLQDFLNETVDKLSSIEKIEEFIYLRDRDPEMFYQIAPEILKSNNIDINKYFIDLIPPLNDTIVMYFINAFEGKNTKENFEIGEKETIKIKNQLIQAKLDVNKQINEARLELLKEENKNPLESIPFGRESKIESLFLYNPDSTIKRIKELVVDILKNRNKPNIPYKKGKLDFRRTMKNSIGSDGIPINLYYRNKDLNVIKEKPKIYLILDVSGSCRQFIPLCSTLAYAFTFALQEYEITLFTASNPYMYTYSDPKIYFEEITRMEKKNIIGQSNVIDIVRLNQKYITTQIKNPSILNAEISIKKTDTSDYSMNLVEALINIAPENSIFLVFTDNGFRNNYVLSNYIKSSKFCTKFTHFKNNIFYFNLREIFSARCIAALKDFKYGNAIDYRTGENYNDLLLPICPKSEIPIKNIYPSVLIPKRPVNYNDWLEEVLKLLKTALI